MKRNRKLIFLFCLLFLSALSACRMTEAEIRKIPPELLQKSIAMGKDISNEAPRQAEATPVWVHKLLRLLVVVAVFAVILRMFAWDWKPKRKRKKLSPKKSLRSPKKRRR